MVGLAFGAIEWTQNVWFVTYAIEAKGVADDLARFSVAFFTAGMIVVRLAVVWLGNRSNAPALVLGLVVLALLGAVGLGPAEQVALLFTANFTLGLGIGALFPVLLGIAMDRNPPASSSYSSILIITTTAGAQAASVFVGVLAGNINFSAAYLAVPVFALILIGGVSLFLPAPRKA